MRGNRFISTTRYQHNTPKHSSASITYLSESRSRTWCVGSTTSEDWRKIAIIHMAYLQLDFRLYAIIVPCDAFWFFMEVSWALAGQPIHHYWPEDSSVRLRLHNLNKSFPTNSPPKQGTWFVNNIMSHLHCHDCQPSEHLIYHLYCTDVVNKINSGTLC